MTTRLGGKEMSISGQVLKQLHQSLSVVTMECRLQSYCFDICCSKFTVVTYFYLSALCNVVSFYYDK